ncbi:MAG: hypothetical protein AAF485_28500 [Chloroflexota bacterium]
MNLFSEQADLPDWAKRIEKDPLMLVSLIGANPKHSSVVLVDKGDGVGELSIKTGYGQGKSNVYHLYAVEFRRLGQLFVAFADAIDDG